MQVAYLRKIGSSNQTESHYPPSSEYSRCSVMIIKRMPTVVVQEISVSTVEERPLNLLQP